MLGDEQLSRLEESSGRLGVVRGDGIAVVDGELVVALNRTHGHGCVVEAEIEVDRVNAVDQIVVKHQTLLQHCPLVEQKVVHFLLLSWRGCN